MKYHPLMSVHRIYIQGERWKDRKRVYYASHGKKCAACFGTVDVDLHHMTYKRLGNEWDADLVPLCRDCHKNFHLMFPGKGRNMKKQTMKFIRLEQERVAMAELAATL